MCFSETASFGLSAALVPIGIFGIKRAWRDCPDAVPFACFPLAFASQQFAEGLVWHGVNTSNAELTAMAARGFLFFSHFFWLWFPPLATLALETQRWRQQLLTLLTVIGGCLGASLFFPVALHADWLVVAVTQSSIDYQVTLIWDSIVSRGTVHTVYSVTVVASLLASSRIPVRRFGIFVVFTVILARWCYAYAFISVWCFFAAAISATVPFVIRKLPACSPKSVAIEGPTSGGEHPE